MHLASSKWDGDAVDLEPDHANDARHARAARRGGRWRLRGRPTPFCSPGRPARKAAGEGKRDSWKALTSARPSVDEAARRHLGQNEDGRDDGDARRSRARQVEVGPERLQHQRAPDGTKHRAESATATGASWRAQVGWRCHRPRSGLKRGQPSRSRGARWRQPARWRAWSGAELAAAHLLMSSTVVARSVSSGWSRPYGGSGRPPCVGRPALDPLIAVSYTHLTLPTN